VGPVNYLKGSWIDCSSLRYHSPLKRPELEITDAFWIRCKLDRFYIYIYISARIDRKDPRCSSLECVYIPTCMF